MLYIATMLFFFFFFFLVVYTCFVLHLDYKLKQVITYFIVVMNRLFYCKDSICARMEDLHIRPFIELPDRNGNYL